MITDQTIFGRSFDVAICRFPSSYSSRDQYAIVLTES